MACRSLVGLDEFSVEPDPPSGAGDDGGSNQAGSGNNSGDGDGDSGVSGGTAGDVDGGDSGGATASGGAAGQSAGGGGAGGMNSAGMNGGGGSMPGGGTAGSDCGAPPMPGTCTQGPGQCDGMCDPFEQCVRECTTDDCGGAFMMMNIVACGPPEVGFACAFLCNADGACGDAVEVSCPMSEPCTVDCSMPGACLSATITCREGPCQVLCGSGGCDNTTIVNCGPGPCIVNCMPGADATQNAGPSCAAEKINCGQ